MFGFLKKTPKITELPHVLRRKGVGTGEFASYVVVNDGGSEHRFLVADNLLCVWEWNDALSDGPLNRGRWTVTKFDTNADATAECEARVAALRGARTYVEVEMLQVDLDAVADGQAPPVRFLATHMIQRLG